MKLDKFKEILQRESLLGLIEKLLFQGKKAFWTFYYSFRIPSHGNENVFTGKISVRGCRKITIGSNCVFEEGAAIAAGETGALSLGNQCFVGKNASLIANGQIQIGNNVSLLANSQIVSSGKITLSDQVWIAQDCTISGNDIQLAAHAILGPGVFVIDVDHQIDGTNTIQMTSGVRKPIRIGANAWIGAKSVVLKGVTLGKSAVVGAGSVVTKDVPDHATVAGNPATTIKRAVPS